MSIHSLRRLCLYMPAFLLAACSGDGSSSTSSSKSAGATTSSAGLTVSVSSPAMPLINSPVSFTSGTTSTNLNYSWNYGDGSALDTTSGATPKHTYANSGSYHVAVTTTDKTSGGTATASATISVYNPKLQANISQIFPASPQANQIVSVSSLSNNYPFYLQADNGYTYTWDFGDGGPGATGATAQHVYVTPGTYTISLQVTDDNLDIGIATTTVIVAAATSSAKVSSAFIYSAPDSLQNIIFTGAGTGQGYLTYTWDFGDKNSATGQSVSHAYATTGTYNVVLTVTDSTGTSATSTQSVSSNSAPASHSGPPTAQAITANPLMPSTNQAITFNGTATGTGPLTYSWDFGDGVTAGSSNNSSSTHTYTAAGSYAVTLTVNNPAGQTATASSTIVVTNSLSVSVLAGFLGPQGSTDGTGIGAQFNIPRGTATDSAGNIYVADTGNNIIRKITSAGVVTTLAGTASTLTALGCTDVDATGSAAVFCAPMALTVDTSGNLFVTEGKGETIRKITPAGVVSTFAGQSGAMGTSDGTAGAARFNNPTGITIDGQNNLYVADTGNNAVRKITPAGIVSTLTPNNVGRCTSELDGNVSTATFCSPTGIAVDSTGTIFVADTGANTIRKITSAGVVNTIAGYLGNGGCQLADGTGSAAAFCRPGAIALSGSNLFVVDQGNNSIRQVTTSGVVTTLAGEGVGYANGTGAQASFNAPGGIAIDSNNNLYVADTGNNLIRKMTTTGTVSALAGSTVSINSSIDGTGSAARFSNPMGIATDSSGNVYVADTGTQTIRKITTPGGAVTTLAGGTTQNQSYYPCIQTNGSYVSTNSLFCNLKALTTDSSGNVYAIDNNLIRKITPAGVVTTLAGGSWYCGSYDGQGSSAAFCNPSALTVDSTGNVYVADSGNGVIRKITPTGLVSTLAGSYTPYYGWYLSSCQEQDGTGTAAKFCQPYGITIDKSNNLYVSDYLGNTVRMVTPAGVVTTLAGNGKSGWADSSGSFAQFWQPSTIAMGNNGKLYVQDSNGMRVVTTSGTVSTLPGASSLLPSSSSGNNNYFALLPTTNQMVFGYKGIAIQITTALN